MNRRELYAELRMSDFFAGGSIEYDIANEALYNEQQVLDLLDDICLSENLTPLKGKWKKLNFEDGSRLLMNALKFDLAFTTVERMPKEKASYFYEQIVSKINVHACDCYTNWFENPWENSAVASWNPLTRHTFDMAIVLLDNKKLVFTYLISED